MLIQNQFSYPPVLMLSRLPDLIARFRPTIVVSSLTILSCLFPIIVRSGEPPPQAKVEAITRLFIDWAYVHSGRMESAMDPALISPEGFAMIERDKKEWGIKPDLSGHGMKRNRLPYGLRISIEKARKSAPWLRADQPWEKQIAWVTVIHEAGKYRCWYWVYNDKLRPDFETLLCYAESTDAVHWTKPEVGIHSFPGFEKNNIVTLWNHESAVFRDESAPASERYKAFIWDKSSTAQTASGTPETAEARYGLYGVVSADGYHWTRLPDILLSDFHDTQNIVHWDGEKQKYVAYLRGAMNGRAISYAETTDFRKWPNRAEIIAHPGALDAPSDDYYTNGFTRYPEDPSLRLFFSAIYHHASDLIDVRLGVTRNGKVINWVSYEPIVEVGAPGEFDSGAVFTGPNLVRLPDGTLALPYRGMNYTHNEWFYTQLYKDAYDETGKKRTVSFAWAIWDDGRLAGIEADNLGEFWTRDEKFAATQILINARTTRSGSIEVELWEPDSLRTAKPIPGYSFAECIPFHGDGKWEPLKWKGKNDLSELKGKTIQMRIRLSSAKIFGYRLVN